MKPSIFSQNSIFSQKIDKVKMLRHIMNSAPTTGDVLLGIATADRQELRLIQDALKARWATLTKEEATAFTVGQKVFFMSRSGVRIEGEVEKINRKTIGVKTDSWTSYRVSPSLLEVC